MFSLYTTESILTKIYKASDTDDSTTWYSFITKLCSSLYVLFEIKSDFDTNEYNPVFQLAHIQNIPIYTLNDTEGHNNTSYLSAVISQSLDVIDDPTAIFLLDNITPTEARQISATYGIVCHSFQESPEKCPIFSEPYEIFLAKEEQGKSWHDLLQPEYVVPTNSLVIIDRYLFDNSEQGLANLKDIINSILPQDLGPKVEYHILVVFDSSHIKSKSATNSNSGPISTKDSTIIDSQSLFEIVSTKINKFKKSLEKSYPIVIETISIDSNNGVYSETHNRRIVSNYFIIRAPHALQAFNISKEQPYTSLHSQAITFDWAASKGIVISKRSDTPAKELFNTLDNIKKAIKQYIESVASETVKFSQNGKLTHIKEIKNRLIGIKHKN